MENLNNENGDVQFLFSTEHTVFTITNHDSSDSDRQTR